MAIRLPHSEYLTRGIVEEITEGETSVMEDSEVPEPIPRRTLELRLKECNGELTPEEFYELLILDFQELLIDNPPIEEIFYPEEELDRISVLPPEQRKAALISFKEKLTRQHIAHAYCQVSLGRLFTTDPDTRSSKAYTIINNFSRAYGFTREQQEYYHEALEAYYEEHERILDVVGAHPDPTELVKFVTGIEPTGDKSTLEILVGPLSIDIITDRVTAHSIYLASPENKETTDLNGFATYMEELPGISYTVIAEDVLNREAILRHERQHVVNRFMERFMDKRPMWSIPRFYLDKYEELKKGNNTKEKRETLEVYFKLERERALFQVQDEIIAWKRQEEPEDGSRRIKRNLNRLFRRGGRYDYLEEVRNAEGREEDNLWQATADRMLTREYFETIRLGIAAFNKLETEGGHSVEMTIALLSYHPISKWPKVAKRLLAH